MTKSNCSECTSNYRESSFNKDDKYCNNCGRELVENEHILHEYCKRCGKKKIYLYRECPIKLLPFYHWRSILDGINFNYHTSNLIETYSR